MKNLPQCVYDTAYLRDVLSIDATSPESLLEHLPFLPGDVAAGVENELQTAVIGSGATADLPITIRESEFFMNIRKRVHTGESPGKSVSELEKFLNDNKDYTWENSWVRFPRMLLNRYARNLLETDLKSDKRCPDSPQRSDVSRFIFSHHQETWLRVPVSYLIKLSLADIIGRFGRTIPRIWHTGEALMRHFTSDNTSPETFSFQPVRLTVADGMGQASAAETLKRYLLTHLLAEYANQQFQLHLLGQQVRIYFAPHPPLRLKQLNDLIPDAFYRRLFMNPCLSGWDRGEEKHQYMHLCHQALSRSQLNAVAKLKDAGIINNNLVVLPNVSNISLANNGTHVSLSSRKLGQLLTDPGSGFGAAQEKYYGDLVIKIVEHFLPLFVNTYSADPFRMDFWDFHPEKALGFLPHELDYTHLRMLWRRWKKKASLKALGYALTPMGPQGVDRFLSRIFGLKGDLILDYRLMDYLVCLLSTERSPALNGQEGNDIGLKKNLADMGVFDARMALYLFYRLRRFHEMGFSGFEGRYYSLFHSFTEDMGPAVSLQALITAYAYKAVITRKVTHLHIPDSPVIESERRQILFGAAIGIPTFFVEKDTPNVFMRKILAETARTRPSSRYPNYIRVHHIEYRRALVKILRRDAADLIEMMYLKEVMNDLEARIDDPEHAASGKLTRQILDHAGAATPFRLRGDEFNRAAEAVYRNDLRRQHLTEAMSVFEKECLDLEKAAATHDSELAQALRRLLREKSLREFLPEIRDEVLKDRINIHHLGVLICILVLLSHYDTTKNENAASS